MKRIDVTSRPPASRSGLGLPAALLGIACATLLLAEPAAAQSPLPLSRDEVEALRGPPTPEFCENGEGHPHFGQDFCRGLERTQSSAEMEPMLQGLQGDVAVEPFCRPGENGHPEFGRAWCQMKRAERSGGVEINPSLLQGAPSGTVRSELFCVTGRGHPEFGMDWCRMTDEQWSEYMDSREGPPPRR